MPRNRPRPCAVEIELGHEIELLATHIVWDRGQLSSFDIEFQIPTDKGPVWYPWPKGIPVPDSIAQSIAEAEE